MSKNSRGEAKWTRVAHPVPPLYDKDSRILILGSFPSVKSRETAFFYGHPQNRFWKTIADILSEAAPETIEEKKEFLHRNHIALWDVIKSCEIVGSSDSSIRSAEPSDLSEIFETADIREIFCNGAKAYQYYGKYQAKQVGKKAVKLPSTSPANAAFTMERLEREWSVICRSLKAAPQGIGGVLLRWYDYNARILPWRSEPTPYHVWISEIMLQQTRVEAVKKYYSRWMEELPDIKTLAGIPDDKLMKLWEGLGYYNRARNIKEAAKTVMEKYGGELPDDYEKLLSLKGIGEYTAGAIASIAFGLPTPAVDGNVLRVFSRLLGEEGDIGRQSVKKSITKEVKRVMPAKRPGDFNQALMDLGAVICLPHGQPLCGRCPWEPVCQAHLSGRETEYPVKAEKKARKKEQKAVFLIEIEGGRKIILHKRPVGGLLPDLWEFPNVEGAFTMQRAEKQAGAWGLEGYEIEYLGEGKHIFSHVEWQMTGYRLRLPALPKNLMEEQRWRAVSKKEARQDYAIPSAFDCYKKRLDD